MNAISQAKNALRQKLLSATGKTLVLFLLRSRTDALRKAKDSPARIQAACDCKKWIDGIILPAAVREVRSSGRSPSAPDWYEVLADTVHLYAQTTLATAKQEKPLEEEHKYHPIHGDCMDCGCPFTTGCCCKKTFQCHACGCLYYEGEDCACAVVGTFEEA